MKKISSKRKAWLIRNAWKSNRRRIRRKQAGKYYRATQAGKANPHSTTVELRPPEIMSLTSNHAGVVRFLHKFREVAIASTERVRVDFTAIRELSPGAALVLTAELDRWRRVRGINLRPYKFRHWHVEIKRLLSEMGFFEILQQSRSLILKTKQKPTLSFVKFISDDASSGDLADKLIDESYALVGREAVSTQLMFAALSESITNVVQHAYPEDGEYQYEVLHRRWWLSGSYDSSTNKLTLMCYDQGVGIPKTLPNQGFEEVVQRLLKGDRNDANMIAAAMEIGRTSTKLSHRGKGLKQVYNFAKENDGKLRIISGKGEYRWCGDEGISLHHHLNELGGTFIQWEFDLGPGGKHVDKNDN